MESTKIIIKKVMGNFLLILIAVFLLKYLLIPGIVVTLLVSFRKRKIGEGFTSLYTYFKQVAIGVDQLGNVICKDLLNSTLLKGNSYKFGNTDETISGVIGKNQITKTLSKAGNVLNWILNKLETNHTVKSIENDETNN